MTKRIRYTLLTIITIVAMLLTEMLILSMAHADYYQRKLENTWQWQPATGTPAFYEVQKSLDGGDTWIVVGQTPHELVEGFVQFTVVSPKDESYQLRVRAADAAGNFGKFSFISDVLHINTSPGQPELVED